MNNLAHSSIPKKMLDITTKVVKKYNASSKVKSKTEVKKLQKLKLSKQNNKSESISNRIDYSNDLSRLMDTLSQTMSDVDLSETESFTLNSFLNTIKGLQNLGNTRSAYVIAQNAMTYLSGRSYANESMLKINSLRSRGVEVHLSETAKMYKHIVDKHISMENDMPNSLLKGTYFNRIV